ncbi:MAG TPA: hypothetical protein PLP01_10510 [Phycisphaerae bacterium]|nr:hypothetical protein [Phycisphaerae bacterium]HOI55671.1 hypothetical protein [Phycisphaerae bacterium]
MAIRKKNEATKPSKKTAEALLKEAMRHPGVAEVMKIYGDLQEVVQSAAPYVAAMDEKPVLLVSTSSD